MIKIRAEINDFEFKKTIEKRLIKIDKLLANLTKI